MLMIGIHHCYKRGSSCTEAFDCRTCKPATTNALDHANARITQGQRARFVGSPIGRIVIHDQDLPAGLAKRTCNLFDQRPQIAPFIERRQNDRQFE